MNQGLVSAGGEVVLYEAPDGEVRVDVRLERETVWLTQLQMATLFGTTPENVLMHLKNVYAEKELAARSTTKDFLAVRTEGKRRVRRKLKHYNLDAIISVGYRVNSKRGTQFRIWATRTLKDHLLRGYTLNEKRLRERGLAEIEQAVGLLARTLTHHALVTDERMKTGLLLTSLTEAPHPIAETLRPNPRYAFTWDLVLCSILIRRR